MGTKDIYEEKLRTGNLHHDPTINTGLSSARCPRCLSRLNPNSKGNEAMLHDVTALVGSLFGTMLGFVHCLYTGLPYLQKCLKGPKWLPFVVGIPPLLIIPGASAAFGGYVLPKFARLSVTTYCATESASYYGISLLTRHIEENYNSDAQPVKRL